MNVMERLRSTLLLLPLTLFLGVYSQSNSFPIDCEALNQPTNQQNERAITTNFIYLGGQSKRRFTAYCLNKDSIFQGGWTVIQQRADNPSITEKANPFNGKWLAYKTGFGNNSGPANNYWFGNDALYQMTKSTPYSLLVVVRTAGEAKFAAYDGFQIEGEAKHYRAHLGQFRCGDVGDILQGLNGAAFSTADRGVLQKCGQLTGVGWWFTNNNSWCNTFNMKDKTEPKETGLNRRVMMLIRRTPLSSVDCVEKVPTITKKIRPKSARDSNNCSTDAATVSRMLERMCPLSEWSCSRDRYGIRILLRYGDEHVFSDDTWNERCEVWCDEQCRYCSRDENEIREMTYRACSVSKIPSIYFRETCNYDQYKGFVLWHNYSRSAVPSIYTWNATCMRLGCNESCQWTWPLCTSNVTEISQLHRRACPTEPFLPERRTYMYSCNYSEYSSYVTQNYGANAVPTMMAWNARCSKWCDASCQWPCTPNADQISNMRLRACPTDWTKMASREACNYGDYASYVWTQYRTESTVPTIETWNATCTRWCDKTCIWSWTDCASKPADIYNLKKRACPAVRTDVWSEDLLYWPSCKLYEYFEFIARNYQASVIPSPATWRIKCQLICPNSNCALAA